MQGGVNLYSYVSNDPINKTDPLGLYKIDVHYYLTYYLARKTSCFTDSQSRAIANGDQLTDELEDQFPGRGRTVENSKYHALHEGAQEGVGSQQLWNEATSPNSNFQKFGSYLHYLQDTFSHRGFPDSYWGHASRLHYYDKTDSDVPRAMRMAGSTWKAMKEFARTLGCKCDPKWAPEIQNTVFDFARTAGANFGALNTIDSNGNDYLDFYIKNPSGYLDRKIRILGVPRR